MSLKKELKKRDTLFYIKMLITSLCSALLALYLVVGINDMAIFLENIYIAIIVAILVASALTILIARK